MSDKTDIIRDRKNNIRLYTIYKMLSNDLLFYYAIDFLFLTQVKGIDVAIVLFAETMYTIFRFVLQIPCTIFVDRIGIKKSLVIANISVAVYVLLVILCIDSPMLIIANIFAAFGYTIKGICGPSLLYDLIPEGKSKGEVFSRVDGKGTAYYYYIYAFSAIASGYLFMVNGYIPMVLCLGICIYSIYLVFRFKELDEKNNKRDNKVTIKSQLKDMRSAFIYIFKSKRLSILLIFYSIVSGFMVCFPVFRKSLLSDIHISPEYFGIIFAILGIISAISSNNQNKFHNRYKNKTLSRLSITFMITCIVSGIAVFIKLPTEMIVFILVSMYVLQYVVMEPFLSLSKRYLGNFATSSLRIKIYSASDLLYNLVRAIIGLAGTVLLSITSTAMSVIILSVIFTITTLVILKHMKTRVGLKPEEYNKKDIEY